jgi:sugar phosphate permease
MSVRRAPSPRGVHAPVGAWLLAVSVYLLAVLHRTSLGVAGLLAEQRFSITAAELSIFIFLQLGVYAAMQVPTGVLVDRYGPRRLLITASLLMGSAQLVFALVPSYPVALLARGLLGCGDALTFISVLRLVARYVSPRRYPVLVALTSTFGLAGNIVATLPLAVVLHRFGWTFGFGVAGLLSLAAAVAVLVLLRDGSSAPPTIRGAAELRAGIRTVTARVRDAWLLPATRLGFWVHFTGMSSATAFGVLWGNTYLIKAAGLSAAGAGTVLMIDVIASMIAGPIIGWLIGHRPATRVPLAVVISLTALTGWLVAVSVFGDHPPTAYVVALFVVMTLGGPASMVGFALARDYNPARTLGTASGVVNVGGFLATVVIAVGIGWALDGLGGITAHTLRWAVLVAVAVQAWGTVRVLAWYRRTRAFALTRQASGETVPVAVVRHRWDLPVGVSG